METLVWITTSFVGWHCWPDAPKGREYLANVHRHDFKVRVEARVTDSDRQIEFHDLQDMTDAIINNHLGWVKFPDNKSPMSCEQMAMTIATKLKGERINVESVSVSEDGECGARVRIIDVHRQGKVDRSN